MEKKMSMSNNERLAKILQVAHEHGFEVRSVHLGVPDPQEAHLDVVGSKDNAKRFKSSVRVYFDGEMWITYRK